MMRSRPRAGRPHQGRAACQGSRPGGRDPGRVASGGPDRAARQRRLWRNLQLLIRRHRATNRAEPRCSLRDANSAPISGSPEILELLKTGRPEVWPDRVAELRTNQARLKRLLGEGAARQWDRLLTAEQAAQKIKTADANRDLSNASRSCRSSDALSKNSASSVESWTARPAGGPSATRPRPLRGSHPRNASNARRST